jgi:hypothetical protein
LIRTTNSKSRNFSQIIDSLPQSFEQLRDKLLRLRHGFLHEDLDVFLAPPTMFLAPIEGGIRVFFRWLAKERYLLSDPAALLELPKSPVRLPDRGDFRRARRPDRPRPA